VVKALIITTGIVLVALVALLVLWLLRREPVKRGELAVENARLKRELHDLQLEFVVDHSLLQAVETTVLTHLTELDPYDQLATSIRELLRGRSRLGETPNTK
jgi:hypothetical protein